MNQSYWQIGCNDAYTRRPRQFSPLDLSLQARGYRNGYEAGKVKRVREDYHIPPEVEAALLNHGNCWRPE